MLSARSLLIEPAGYRPLAETGAVRLAFCWAHVRRRFYELAQAGPAPIAAEALVRIKALYAIEADIRGRDAQARLTARQGVQASNRRLGALAARQSGDNQSEDQTGRGDPLRAVALGGPDPVPG